MTRISLALGLALVVLAGCKEQASSVAEENDRRAEAAAKTADPDLFKAGRWETKTRIDSVSNARLDASSKSEIVEQESALDQCLPEDETRRPDANFFAGGDGSECQYTNFAMAEGRLSATMNCTATPGTIVMTLNGSYTPTSYALDASATTSGAPGAPMNTTAKLSGTWLGPCRDPASQRVPDTEGS